MRKIIISGLATSILALAGCSTGGVTAQHIPHFENAIVTAVEDVYTPSGWKTGTAVGGGVGLLAGRGHGTESKVYRAAGGALIGAALQKGLTDGKTTYKVQVATSRGEVLLFNHRDGNMNVGDCVKFDMNNVRGKLYHTNMNDCNFSYRKKY